MGDLPGGPYFSEHFHSLQDKESGWKHMTDPVVANWCIKLSFYFFSLFKCNYILQNNFKNSFLLHHPNLNLNIMQAFIAAQKKFCLSYKSYFLWLNMLGQKMLYQEELKFEGTVLKRTLFCEMYFSIHCTVKMSVKFNFPIFKQG